jgi:hypothetical protein
MLDMAIEHPHPCEARAERWADIEEAIRCLQEIGWRLERFAQVDEPGTALRAYLRLSWEQPPPFDGII